METIMNETINMPDNFIIIARQGDYVLSMINKGTWVEYATHYYNAERKDLNWGHYVSSLEKALEDLKQRAESNKLYS